MLQAAEMISPRERPRMPALGFLSARGFSLRFVRKKKFRFHFSKNGV